MVYMLNDIVNILFYSQQLAASAIKNNFKREVLLYLLQVQAFTCTSSTFF